MKQPSAIANISRWVLTATALTLTACGGSSSGVDAAQGIAGGGADGTTEHCAGRDFLLQRWGDCGWVRSVSADGRFAVLMGYGPVCVVDMEHEAVIATADHAPDRYVEMSPAGDRVVFSGDGGFVLDVASGSTAPLGEEADCELAPRFSADGGTLYFGRLRRPDMICDAMARDLATGADRSLVPRRNPPRNRPGAPDDFYWAVSEDGRFRVSLRAGRLLVWDGERRDAGPHIEVPLPKPKRPSDKKREGMMGFAPWSHRLAVAWGGRTAAFDLPAVRPIWKLDFVTEQMAFDRRGKRLALMGGEESEEETLRVVDASTGGIVREVAGSCDDPAFSADAARVGCGSPDRRVVDLESGEWLDEVVSKGYWDARGRAFVAVRGRMEIRDQGSGALLRGFDVSPAIRRRLDAFRVYDEPFSLVSVVDRVTGPAAMIGWNADTLTPRWIHRQQRERPVLAKDGPAVVSHSGNQYRTLDLETGEPRDGVAPRGFLPKGIYPQTLRIPYVADAVATWRDYRLTVTRGGEERIFPVNLRGAKRDTARLIATEIPGVLVALLYKAGPEPDCWHDGKHYECSEVYPGDEGPDVGPHLFRIDWRRGESREIACQRSPIQIVGELMLVTEGPRQIEIYRLGTGQRLSVIEAAYKDAEVRPGSRTVALCTRDELEKTPRLVVLETETDETLLSEPMPCERVEWIAGGRLLQVLGRGSVRLIDVDRGARLLIEQYELGDRDAPAPALLVRHTDGSFDAPEDLREVVGYRERRPNCEERIVTGDEAVARGRAAGLLRDFFGKPSPAALD